MELPEIDGPVRTALEWKVLRDRALLERRALPVVRGVVVATSVVTILSSVVLAVAGGVGTLLASGVVIASTLGLVATLATARWWVHRRTAAALRELRPAFGAPPPSWIGPLFVVAAALAAGVAGGMGQPWAVGGVLALVTVLGPLLRADRARPAWAVALMTAWGLVGALLFAVWWDRGMFLALAWLLIPPWGLTGQLLRGPIARAMERTDRLGAAVRALAPLLPPPQRARGLRLTGHTDAALRDLVGQLSLFQETATAVDLFHELAGALETLGDLRAVAVAALATRAAPDDPRAFRRLAGWLGVRDPVRSDVLASVAEDFEARRLTASTTK